MVPRRDVEPESRFRRDGIEERCVVVAADIQDYETHAADPQRARGRRGVPPGRADHRGHRQPLAAVDLRGQRARHLRAARGLPGHRRGGVGDRARWWWPPRDKAYGSHDELPYREDFPLQPRFPYDVSKACTDLIARSYAHTYGLPVAVTRLANVYGGGDLNWSRVVPDTAQALVKGNRPGDPLRRHARARLPLRRGRRRGLPGGRRPRWPTSGCAAGRGTPAGASRARWRTSSGA